MTDSAGPVQLPLRDQLHRARLALPPGGPAYRHQLADLTDAALQELWDKAVGQLDGGGIDLRSGVALVAVGSLGRRDGGPASDLDLLLVHEGLGVADLAELSAALWYPIWDARLGLDHSVRTLSECRQMASADLPAAVGLLRLRTVAGDAALGARTAEAVLADWRRAARRRISDLADSVAERVALHGELAYLIEPDLKESRGGLRDAVLIDALVASWLAERPRGALDAATSHLLDVRDALAHVTGRSRTKLRLGVQDDVADTLGLARMGAVVDTAPDGADVHDYADDLLASLAEAGRVVSAALDRTLRTARHHVRSRTPGPGAPSSAQRAPRWRLPSGRRPAPRLPALAPGLAQLADEIVLDAAATARRVRADDSAVTPLLALRAASAACRTGLPLSPTLLTALGDAPAPPSPWPVQYRQLLAEILTSGPAQIPVWEDLDLAGVVTTWFPEWQAVRNRPQRNAVHRFTVDRHQVEAAANIPATAAAGAVEREDLLALAALLHDIGKLPGERDHSAAGARIARLLLDRLGLGAAERDLVVLLVRHHLLLAELATSRDPRDPDVVAEVVQGVRGERDTLVMLRRLTEADARAAGPKAWSSWRARLIDELTARALDAL